MKIGIVDVDSHNFPNLALMKISAWHKANGDEVEFVNPLLPYDIVYQAKVFDFTTDFITHIQADKIITGGTGYNFRTKLPVEIEKQYPDYGLYGIKNIAYGYLTRGCPRGCPFCIVQKKEGNKSTQVADLKQFWQGQREIKLLDPNLLACRDHLKLLQQLVDSKAKIDFTQGIDIRLMTDESIWLIKQMKIKMLHFAWDREKDSNMVIKKLAEFKATTNIDFRRLRVYVLTNYESNIDFDLYRIYKLRELGYDPYVMIYDKQNAPSILRSMARWVNNKYIFRTTKAFEDYNANFSKCCANSHQLKLV